MAGEADLGEIELDEEDDWEEYNYILPMKYMFDGAKTLSELAASLRDFADVMESYAVEHELSDPVDGSWVPIVRKDGGRITLND